jgi:hypothetical protein
MKPARTARKAYREMWNLSTNTALVLGPRKTTEDIDGFLNTTLTQQIFENPFLTSQ